MSPAAIASRALPYGALAATVVALVMALRYGRRRAGLEGRPLLLVALVLGAAPLGYVELVWARAISGGYVRFERPAWAAVCAIAVGYVSLRLGRLSTAQSCGRRAATEALLCMSALSAGLAVIGPEAGLPHDDLVVVAVVDRSRSIDQVPDADARLRTELDLAERSMRPGDSIGMVAFAAGAAAEDPPRPRGANPPSQRAELGRDATDLAAGIRRALGELPAETAARLVLVTDGLATRGDTLAAAAGAVAAGVPIDAIALEPRAMKDVRVVALRMPSQAAEREPLELRVVTSSPARTGIEIRIKRDGETVARGHAVIDAGEDVVRLREIAPSAAGLHQYDVEVSADDAALDMSAEDNAASAFVRVRGAARALVLEGEAGKARFVAKALTDAAFTVELSNAAGAPADAAGLAAYDLVVFSDIAAPDLTPAQVAGLASYSRDAGGGLLLLGGDRSMGPGGYAKTPLEDVSPVAFDSKQERRGASLAEVMAIDYSGSMGALVGSQTKLDLANEAASRSAALLGPGDRVGVEHVDTAVRWTIPLGGVEDASALGRAIRSVGVGGGGIYVDSALDAAYAALARERTNLKHLLLFADGSDAERLQGCRLKTQEAARHGVTTSVVALGKGNDVPELEALSKAGGGRFYLIEDATRLPAVFAQETILASKSSIHEVDFRPTAAAPGPATRGIDFLTAPSLRGYVVTITKARASTHLVGPDGDPVLATWSAGVGRVGAFTSDLKDRWGIAWTSWPGAARMVAQLARDLARHADDPRIHLDAEASAGELRVRATVVGDDGRASTFRRLEVRAVGPDGATQSVPLEAVGAGAYAASLPIARPGTYITTVVDELDGEAVAVAGAAMSAGEELRPRAADRALLARVSSMTGGKVRDSLAGIFDDRPRARFAYTPLAPALLVAAAAALLASVAARRLAWSDAVTRLRSTLTKARAAAPNEPPRSTLHAAATRLLVAKTRRRQATPPALDVTDLPARSSPEIASTHNGLPPLQPEGDATRPNATKAAAENLLERRRRRK